MYKEITSVAEWKELLSSTSNKVILLFKHSTTCPISFAAYQQFTSFESPIETYLVKVREHRDVSDEIAADISVKHESPQALLITNGKAVWQATHRQITVHALTEGVSAL